MSLSVSRGIKTTVLFLLCASHLYCIALLFSHYMTRRDVEDQLGRIRPGTSIETVKFEARRGSDIVRRMREYRCLQRDAITFYRIATMGSRQDLSRVYAATLPMRDAARVFVTRHADKLNVERSQANINNAHGLPVSRDLVFKGPVPDQGVIDEYQALQAGEVTKLNAVIDRMGPETRDVLRLAIDSLDAKADPLDVLHLRDARLLDFSSVMAFETTLAKLKKEYEAAGLDQARRDLLVRVLDSDDLLGRRGSEPTLLDEIGLELHSQDDAKLAELDCEGVDRRLARTLGAIDPEGKDAKLARVRAYLSTDSGRPVAGFGELAWAGTIGAFSSVSTSTQTLLVTMLFGSLGALCLQSLRLSRSGYWGTVSDPTWGDIAMAVVLGMAAALMIYLIAALGRLVISDGSRDIGSSAVGAGLVAMLGFVSGFLNDDAFGRIRRFGQDFFRGDANGQAASRLADVEAELGQRLREAGCDRFAEVAAVHGMGSRLADREPFTLFVPADAWFDAQPAAEWRRLLDRDRPPAADALLAHHLHERAALDLTLLRIAAQAGRSLSMADGSACPVTLDAQGNPLLAGVALAATPTVAFRRGLLVALTARLP